MRWLALAGVGMLAGCNAVLGLAPVGGVQGDDDDLDARVIEGDGRPPDDGPGIDAPEDDVDGDGVLNVADNCPTVANTHQDDDDRDAIGDVCDLCPYQSGAVDNADGDAIGDNCGDPSPSTAQCIVWFDGFSYARTHLRYASSTGHGTWSLVAGNAQQSVDTAAEGVLYLDGPAFGNALVLTHVAILSASGPVGQVSAEVGVSSFLSGVTQAVPEGLTGMLAQYLGEPNAKTVARYHVAAQSDLSSEAHLLRPFEPGAGITISIDDRASQAKATVRFDDTPGLPSSVPLSLALSGTGLVGLRTHNAAADFDYLLVVVDRPGASCPPRVEP